MWGKSKPSSEAVVPYTIIEETKDFAYFRVEPGRPITIHDLQKMKDDGFRLVHVETRVNGGNIQSWAVCEKVSPS